MNRFVTFARPTRLLIAGLAALGLTAALAHPPLVFAGPSDHVIAVPEVPPNLKVRAGNKVYLEGHGVGTQSYICMACPNAITPAEKCPALGFAWAFLGPRATLFDSNDEDAKQIITHFNSPNPGEGGRERPTWQDSRDTSAVRANNTAPPAESSADPAFVRPDAVPWLLLPVASTEAGPTISSTRRRADGTAVSNASWR